MTKTGWKGVLKLRAAFTAAVNDCQMKAQRDEVLRAALLALADDWFRQAKARYRSLERAAHDAPDREALESTALAYVSCSGALRTLVSGPASSRGTGCEEALTELGKQDPQCGLGCKPD